MPIRAESAKAPREPTAAEREEHELTHLPYRAWCRHCVRGRGKSEAHRELDAAAGYTVPHVSFDYCFMGQDESKCLPILACRDHKTKFTFCQVVPCKGTGHVYNVKQAVANVEVLGYPKILFKCDQEPAIVEKVVCAVPRSGSLSGGPPAHEQVLHQAHKSLLAVHGSASTMNVRSSTTGTMLRPERPAGHGLLFSPTTLVFPMYV